MTTQTSVAETSSFPLDEMPAGARGYIVALEGAHNLVSRLATMGFVPGARVSMVQNYGRGPLIVLVCQARCALGRREAAQIEVRKETPS